VTKARLIDTVHQVLPSLHVADASGAHTLHARDALRAAGYRSDLFAGHVDAELVGEARPLSELDEVAPAGSAVLYQLAVGSPVVDRLMARRGPLLVNYHNLTPASFFWRWAPDWLSAVEAGRQQLLRLAPRVTHAIAVSEFNRGDLSAAGYRSTSVVAPFVDVGAFAGPSSASRREGPTTWLFVGKLLPHKAAHDVVKAFALYRRAYDPDARLVLVGGHPVPPYAAAVQGLVDEAGLADAVVLAGSVSQDELARRYGEADVFVCLSQHEGFCFPLLESMRHGVPVVALDAGAVADTLGGAGLLVRKPDPALVAATVRRAVTDEPLRRHLVEMGRRRLDVFDLERTKAAFVADVRGALEVPVSVPAPAAAGVA